MILVPIDTPIDRSLSLTSLISSQSSTNCTTKAPYVNRKNSALHFGMRAQTWSPLARKALTLLDVGVCWAICVACDGRLTMPVTRLRGFLILFAFALSGVRGTRDVISLSLSLAVCFASSGGTSLRRRAQHRALIDGVVARALLLLDDGSSCKMSRDWA